MEMQTRLEEIGQGLYPVPVIEGNDLDRHFKLAVNQSNIWPLVRITHYIPGKYRLTDFQVADAIERFFPVE